MEVGAQPVEDLGHSLFFKKLQLTCNTGLVRVITFELYKCGDSLLQDVRAWEGERELGPKNQREASIVESVGSKPRIVGQRRQREKQVKVSQSISWNRFYCFITSFYV